MRKLVSFSRNLKTTPFCENFGNIVVETFLNKGFIVQQLSETHKTVFQNRSRINYRW